jgi:hypothetical protein
MVKYFAFPHILGSPFLIYDFALDEENLDFFYISVQSCGFGGTCTLKEG